jgi:XTP/dITP diphosphohydrolase
VVTPLKRILLATRNQGKLRELRGLVSGSGLEIVGLDEVEGAPDEVEETGVTFADNAILKAVAYGGGAGMAALADDSGLEVDALGGAPGVYSARFAGPGADDAANNRLLLERLAEVPDEARVARFRCVLALYVPQEEAAEALARRALSAPEVSVVSPGEGRPGAVFLTQGSAEGRVLWAPRGASGFGYDPLFLSAELGVSFAEAGAEKAQVSHRARALSSLLGWLLGSERAR